MTNKTSTLTALGVSLCVLVILASLVPTISLVTETATLYACDDSSDISGYYALKTIKDTTESWLTLESASSGYVTIGYSVIKISTLHSQFKHFDSATWTFKYYAVANVTDKANLCVNITIIDSNKNIKSYIANRTAKTSLLSTSNATYTGTVSIPKTTVSDVNYYLRIEWIANKTDTTALKVQLLLDGNNTKIQNVKYTYDALTGTNRTLTYTALTFIFLALALTAIYVGIKKR